MYQDIYIEQSVHRYVPSVTKVLNVLLIIATVIVAFQFVFVNYAVFGIPLVAMIIITYFVSQNAKMDFDYTYTNGLIEITRILRKTRRKDLVVCDMKDVVVIAKSKTDPVKAYIGRTMKTYDCTSHEEGIPYYTMIVRDDKTGAETKVLFEPGEEMLDIMHRISPDKVYI